jgi:formylglycine-generating enzyme required for sulfatase activity
MKEVHTATPVRPQSPVIEMSRHPDMVWISGGTFREDASAAKYCRRYPRSARHPRAVDTSTSHVGFRCIIKRNGAAP